MEKYISGSMNASDAKNLISNAFELSTVFVGADGSAFTALPRTAAP